MCDTLLSANGKVTKTLFVTYLDDPSFFGKPTWQPEQQRLNDFEGNETLTKWNWCYVPWHESDCYPFGEVGE